MHYNPLSYIRNEADILKFVNALITNTKGEGKEGDPFWTKAETLLYCALIAYIIFEGPAEDRNMNTLVDMISGMEVKEDDENYKNAVDYKASKLRLYEKYAAGSITKEAYIQQKTATDAKIAENDEAIQHSHERMKELDSETSCSDEKLDAVCDQYADCKALTYELTHAFISAVYIYDLDNIEIVWKFKDFLTTSEGEAK